MYSGDVPAILSARKTYSFRGIELTLSRLPLALFGRLRHPTTVTPMSALVPLYVYVITPRRRRGLLCFFLSPHSTWNISSHPGISRVLWSVSFAENLPSLYKKRRKHEIFMRSDKCNIWDHRIKLKLSLEKYHEVQMLDLRFLFTLIIMQYFLM